MFREVTSAKEQAQDLTVAESDRVKGTPPATDDLDKTVFPSSFNSESHTDSENTIKTNESRVTRIKDGS